jgi:DNA-binding LacI/PurR family transcriptional regulator
MREKKDTSSGQRPVSIKGISKVTGFSTTTVSMVLNGRAGDFNISDETRDYIIATAKELNYQPNLHARNLRTGRTDILGLMVPTLRNHFFGEMAETFEALARAERKLALISVTQYERAEEASAIRYFLSQQADCIFVANPMELEEVSQLTSGGGTRSIFIDAETNSRNTVTTDNFGAALELTRGIIASHAREGRSDRIYYFGGMADHKVTRLRLSAFQAALAEAGLPFSDDQVIWAPFDAEAAYATVRQHFAEHDDIGGLFVNSMPPMEGLIRYFPEAPSVCRRIHYGVFDYHPYMRLLTDLKIISVKQDPQGIMRTAFDLYRSGEPLDDGRVVTVPHELRASVRIDSLPVSDGKRFIAMPP